MNVLQEAPAILPGPRGEIHEMHSPCRTIVNFAPPATANESGG